MGRLDYETETMVAHALRGEGFDASEDGTGRGTSIIPIDMRQASRGGTFTNNRKDGSSGGSPGTGIGEPGDPSPTIAGSHVPAIAVQAGALRENPDSGPDGIGVQNDIASTLEARAEVQAVAFDLRGREGGSQFEGPHDTANIRASSGGSSRSYVAENWAVRRLTPRECERLQGFPDGYTDVPWRHKNWTPDGPRYKALGNSMAVNAMRWLGRRVDMVERLAEDRPLHAAV
jgi:DNA (cytosine-5)-methyltransferase 1